MKNIAISFSLILIFTSSNAQLPQPGKDAKLNTFFILQNKLVIKKVNNVLAPVQKITELK